MHFPRILEDAFTLRNHWKLWCWSTSQGSCSSWTCIHYRVPYTDFVATFKQEAILSTQLANQNMSLLTGTEYFNVYKTNSVQPWLTKETLSRKYIIIINRCHINHYNLNASDQDREINNFNFQMKICCDLFISSPMTNWLILTFVISFVSFFYFLSLMVTYISNCLFVSTKQ